MKCSFCVCLSPLAFFLFHPALAAGNSGSLDFEQRINGKAVLKIIEPIRERLQDLSAVFFSGHDVVIYGIVLSPDGYIATNYHVIDGATSIKVTLNNGETYDAKLVGGEELNDVAMGSSGKLARTRPQTSR